VPHNLTIWTFFKVSKSRRQGTWRPVAVSSLYAMPQYPMAQLDSNWTRSAVRAGQAVELTWACHSVNVSPPLEPLYVISLGPGLTANRRL
jgi:hypothetical protein